MKKYKLSQDTLKELEQEALVCARRPISRGWWKLEDVLLVGKYEYDPRAKMYMHFQKVLEIGSVIQLSGRNDFLLVKVLKGVFVSIRSLTIPK